MEVVEALRALVAPVAIPLSILASAFVVILLGLVAYLGWALARAHATRDALEERLGLAEGRTAITIAELSEARAVLSSTLKIVDRGGDVWRRKPVAPPPGYRMLAGRSIPILALANLKGGVGKTTLAANLAAYFDRRGERVLLIDLDHQGSLSAMALGSDPRGRDLRKPGALDLLDGRWPHPKRLPWSENNAALIDGYYPISNEESRILYKWILGGTSDDVRFRLAELLQAPRVQTTFDRVLIDTGPRLTLGMVNALTAATHLVIPTQLNAMSVEATNSFLFALDELKRTLRPGLRAHRIVGQQRTWTTPRLSAAEKVAIGQIDAMLDARGELRGTFLRDAIVPNMAGFSRAAGFSVAYCSEPSVRPEIDRLGAEIAGFAPSFAENAA